MNKTSIFVGPRKTGTSWLHHVVADSDQIKEIRYPSLIGRGYVYNKYVADQPLLVWPYLLHDLKSMKALLADMEMKGQQFDLYVSLRDHDDWIRSLQKFLGKLGVTGTKQVDEIESQVSLVLENIGYLEAKYSVTKLKILDPAEGDIELMSRATGVDKKTLIAALDTRIYESVEFSRIKSSAIVELFFRIKPFLPKFLQSITRKSLLRSLFFQRVSNK